MKRIPDFTDARWHLARSDRDLERSVLEGRGSMPAMKKKIGLSSATSMIKLVRRFRGGKLVVSEEGAADDETDRPKARVVAPSPSRLAPVAEQSVRQAEGVPARSVIDSSNPAWRLYGRFCTSCHGEDGRSGPIRSNVPRASDFTSPAWHEGHDAGRLRISILEGRGTRMPAFQGRISEAEAHVLATALRSLTGAPARAGIDPHADFDRRFQSLMSKFVELKRTYYALPQPAVESGRVSREIEPAARTSGYSHEAETRPH
jgi:mono/diheme cytochrome c family protein